MKKVIITGVTGQDGSFMADFLLKNTDCIVLGGVRRLSVPNHENIKHLVGNDRFRLIDLDISDPINVETVIRKEQPDYFINFAANSFVGTSWEMPANHFQTNCVAVLYQLEAIRKYAPACRYYNAGSSEEFGDVVTIPQTEEHPLRPRSPYGAAKASARHLVKVYRDSYKLYAIQGWLFNHEGTRRGVEFVTRKITTNAVRIKKAILNDEDFEPLELGNLEAKRDWSDAEDFVDGVWRMLNQDRSNFVISGWCMPLLSPHREEFLSAHIKEYVLSSNETHTIREFVELAFKETGFGGLYWEGSGLSETLFAQNCLLGKHIGPDTVGVNLWWDANKEKIPLVKINPKFYRPAEVELLLGDSTKARKDLGWEPKSTFPDLVKKMVDSDWNKS